MKHNKLIFFGTLATVLSFAAGFFLSNLSTQVEATTRAVGLIYCVHPCITNSTHPATDPTSCQYRSNPVHCAAHGGYIGTYNGCSGTGLACVFNYTPRPTPTPTPRPCNPRYQICAS